ncbi:hypothetical protein WA026_004959 [Henosepilachna vigintioctopunctata]|uniref:Uncharacterized protein n=1 Tax=Henosepilachna vigintioctopunctata TaxID=420089 RepID=A0AAW1USJ5_9CUCU
MEETVNIVGASKHAYSDKIKDRRRTLFPCDNSEMVNTFSDNSDMDQMNPLSTSDSECESYGVSNNISLIASTNLVSDILSTPNSKNYPPSEQSMSPLYLSPYGNMVVAKSVLSELSPTKHLKTPNYSNIHCGIPKLSRKCSSEKTLDKSDSKESDIISNPPKTSKVRTTLFPELDTISLAPKHFYPKIDFHKPVSDQKVSKQTDMKVQRSTKKKNDSKRLFGQINVGVKHNIKKPKKRKIVSETKISQAQLARIKTFKKDKLVNSELNEYLKDLTELNERKKVRLIQYSSSQDTLESKEDNTSSSLKRANDSVDDTIFKKQKLTSGECKNVSLYENSNNSEVTESINEDLEISFTKTMDEILYVIDNSISQDKENKSEDKENDSNIGENCVSETLLSPTSQMCNMASVMNIDSPKKSKKFELFISKYE